MESAADYYRHLGATSFCSGFSVECMLTLEKHRNGKQGDKPKANITNCKQFTGRTIAALKDEENAPLSIKRIYKELIEQKKLDKQALLDGWQAVDYALTKIENNEITDEKKISASIKFLMERIAEFNHISENVEKKLYASSWCTR
jgi:hypothetical protein